MEIAWRALVCVYDCVRLFVFVDLWICFLCESVGLLVLVLVEVLFFLWCYCG